jgi:phosphate transport system permease protein
MSEIDLAASALEEAPMPRLERQLFERRAMKNGILTALTWGVAVLGSIPLFSVIYMLVIQGGARLDLEALTTLPPAGFEMDGGFGNAIVGTLVMVGIAALISIPLGILAAIYLAVLGPYSKLASVSRFVAKTLTGFDPRSWPVSSPTPYS